MEITEVDHQSHFMMGLLDTHQRLEKSTNREAILFDRVISDSLQEMDQLEQDKRAAFETLSSNSFSRKVWNKVSSAAQFLGRIPTFCSHSIPFSGEGSRSASVLILGSSAISLSASAFRMTGLYKSIARRFTSSEELQEKLAFRLEMGMYTLVLGLAIAGIYKAYHTDHSMLKSSHHRIKGAASRCFTMIKVGEPLVKLKQASVNKIASCAQATIDLKQAAIIQIHRNLETWQKQVEKILQSITTLSKELTGMIFTINKKD